MPADRTASTSMARRASGASRGRGGRGRGSGGGQGARNKYSPYQEPFYSVNASKIFVGDRNRGGEDASFNDDALKAFKESGCKKMTFNKDFPIAE